ncbi:hypothetical protein [Paenibacillus ginsengarvi]|uniref:Uncharacterized protein n=1 Tax=Paenibacillus ginsengarvi TaxID=400777 RepID=A0A3B0CIL6_9BACL|nr:hypothetical protein [Paenibacillus ginsengarvi]RKN85213.1 hypothetical protein D7M11_08985 [Paenibacillus ginsengarvi]
MHRTKLIMVEGIPGSGKSTTAQWISHMLDRQGIAHKWWYEEEKGHPVYIYKDYNSMQPIIDELAKGNYPYLIDRALKRWREFAMDVQLAPQTIVADSCLFGYLTWSLFPYEVPKQVIISYVKAVESIIRPLNPYMIYLYQTDLETSLRKICARRGGHTEDRFVRAATLSPYGASRGLLAFEGMVMYWRDYRHMTDEMFEGLACHKLAIDNSEGIWAEYNCIISKFLGINSHEQAAMVPAKLPIWAGTYQTEQENNPVCSIRMEDGHLIADGLPHAWPRSTLLPVSTNVFHVQSLPLQIEFIEEEDRIKMHLKGPELLGGPVRCTFTKTS